MADLLFQFIDKCSTQLSDAKVFDFHTEQCIKEVERAHASGKSSTFFTVNHTTPGYAVWDKPRCMSYIAKKMIEKGFNVYYLPDRSCLEIDWFKPKPKRSVRFAD